MARKSSKSGIVPLKKRNNNPNGDDPMEYAVLAFGGFFVCTVIWLFLRANYSASDK